MSRNKTKFKKVLEERGFTGQFEFYYWVHDGWYCHCDQMSHVWIGQNWRHVIRQVNEGYLDHYLNNTQ